MHNNPRIHQSSPNSTTRGETASPSQFDRPEFYRLPKHGGDQCFGLTRAWYYQAERQGLLKLVRLRQRGKIRGVVLVPYDEVKRLIEEARGK